MSYAEKIYDVYGWEKVEAEKQPLQNELEKRLRKQGAQNLQVIDGDVIREQFGGIFGYTQEERLKCNQAVRVVVKYLLDNDISVILAQIAAYEEMRSLVRNQFEKHYIEVYIKCSYEECARRDVKGYYQKQKNGQLNNLNGADDIYEVPRNSEIVIDTENETVCRAVDKIMEYLEVNNYGV